MCVCVGGGGGGGVKCPDLKVASTPTDRMVMRTFGICNMNTRKRLIPMSSRNTMSFVVQLRSHKPSLAELLATGRGELREELREDVRERRSATQLHWSKLPPCVCVCARVCVCVHMYVYVCVHVYHITCINNY